MVENGIIIFQEVINIEIFVEDKGKGKVVVEEQFQIMVEDDDDDSLDDEEEVSIWQFIVF